MEFKRTMKAQFAGHEGLKRLGGIVSPLTADGLFTARVNSVRAAHFVVTYAAATPCRVRRAFEKESAGDIGAGQLQMFFPLDTRIQVEDQASRAVEAGDMFVSCPRSRPPLRLESPARVMIISILRGTKPGDIFWPPQCGYFASKYTPSFAVVRAAADILFRSPHRDAGVVALLSRICSSVLADAYIHSTPEGGTHLLAAKAHKFIADAFRRRDCSPQTVAQELHVSLRVLQRAFSDEGGVANTIRAYRIQEALKLLGSQGRLGVDAVARQSGFKDARAMRKALAKNVGMLPSTYRRHFG